MMKTFGMNYIISNTKSSKMKYDIVSNAYISKFGPIIADLGLRSMP